MDIEVRLFTEAVSAKALDLSNETQKQFKALFKKPNYFVFRGSFMIVKVSRSRKPFWGVGKKYIDYVSPDGSYFVVLLINEREGYVFQKADVVKAINNKGWRVANDKDYKVNVPIPSQFKFSSKKDFMKIVGPDNL